MSPTSDAHNDQRPYIDAILASAPERSEPPTELDQLLDDLRAGRVDLSESTERLLQFMPPPDPEEARKARDKAMEQLGFVSLTPKGARRLKRQGVWSAADLKAYRKRERERRKSTT